MQTKKPKAKLSPALQHGLEVDSRELVVCGQEDMRISEAIDVNSAELQTSGAAHACHLFQELRFGRVPRKRVLNITPSGPCATAPCAVAGLSNICTICVRLPNLTRLHIARKLQGGRQGNGR